VVAVPTRLAGKAGTEPSKSTATGAITKRALELDAHQVVGKDVQVTRSGSGEVASATVIVSPASFDGRALHLPRTGLTSMKSFAFIV